MNNKMILASAHHLAGIKSIYPVVSSLRDCGINVDLLVSKLVADKYGSKISDFLVEEYDMDSQISRLIDEKNYGVCFTGTSVRDQNSPLVLDQQVVLQGKQKRIPSISVLDLWKSYNQRFQNEDGNRVFFPDLLCVMDDIARDDLISLGYDVNNIVVTGNPNNDNLLNKKNSDKYNDRMQFRDHLGIASNQKVFLYMGQPLADSEGNHQNDVRKLTFYNIIMSMENLGDNVSLVVRPHPRENLDDLLDIAKASSGERSVIIDGVDTEESFDYNSSINASDLCVGVHTSALVEALYMGVPSMSIQAHLPSAQRVEFPPSRYYDDVLPIIDDIDSLGYAFEYLMQNYASHLKKVNSCGFIPQANATNSIVDIIGNKLTF